jgi:shikimate dehydrogenase
MENASALTAEHFRGAKVAYDLTYNPAETVFLREAQAAGVSTIGGLEMLIRQAEMQFKIWTGADAPAGTMRENVRRKLGQ